MLALAVSSENGLPLFGASVYINHTNQGTITDDSGRFQLEAVPLQSTITISYLGFIDLQLGAKALFNEAGTCQKIVLQEKEEVLNQILITKF